MCNSPTVSHAEGQINVDIIDDEENGVDEMQDENDDSNGHNSSEFLIHTAFPLRAARKRVDAADAVRSRSRVKDMLQSYDSRTQSYFKRLFKAVLYDYIAHGPLEPIGNVDSKVRMAASDSALRTIIYQRFREIFPRSHDLYPCDIHSIPPKVIELVPSSLNALSIRSNRVAHGISKGI